MLRRIRRHRLRANGDATEGVARELIARSDPALGSDVEAVTSGTIDVAKDQIAKAWREQGCPWTRQRETETHASARERYPWLDRQTARAIITVVARQLSCRNNLKPHPSRRHGTEERDD